MGMGFLYISSSVQVKKLIQKNQQRHTFQCQVHSVICFKQTLGRCGHWFGDIIYFISHPYIAGGHLACWRPSILLGNLSLVCKWRGICWKHGSGKFLKTSSSSSIGYKMYLCLRLYRAYFSIFHMAFGFVDIWMQAYQYTVVYTLSFFLYADHCPQENYIFLYI